MAVPPHSVHQVAVRLKVKVVADHGHLGMDESKQAVEKGIPVARMWAALEEHRDMQQVELAALVMATRV